MAENLAYNPSNIDYWVYYNDQSNIAKYGYLYDWETAKKICPAGWHLPSDAEWTTLTNYLGGEEIAGGKLKNTSNLWNSPNKDATNSSGFNAFPSGYRFPDGNFNFVGFNGNWWSATPNGSSKSWIRRLHCNYGEIIRYDSEHSKGYSVRCVRN